MPKMKTKRGAAKRFRRTSTGYKHRSTNRGHNFTGRSMKRKRQLRGMHAVSPSDVPELNRLLPTKAR